MQCILSYNTLKFLFFFFNCGFLIGSSLTSYNNISLVLFYDELQIVGHKCPPLAQNFRQMIFSDGSALLYVQNPDSCSHLFDMII